MYLLTRQQANVLQPAMHLGAKTFTSPFLLNHAIHIIAPSCSIKPAAHSSSSYPPQSPRYPRAPYPYPPTTPPHPQQRPPAL